MKEKNAGIMRGWMYTDAGVRTTVIIAMHGPYYLSGDSGNRNPHALLL